MEDFPMLFFKKKNPDSSSKAASGHYDPETQEPVIRCSICNGEQVAGFCDKKTGSFSEVMLIRTPSDLETFRNQYGIFSENIRKIY